MEVSANVTQAGEQGDQYTLWQILGIWLAGGLPMWLLGWAVYPAVSGGLKPTDAGLLRIELLTAGLVWQFVLSMIILYREEGDIRPATIARRFWLNKPVSPATGRPDGRLWWWLIPLALLVAGIEVLAPSTIGRWWTAIFPFLAAPAGYNAADLFTPAMRSKWVGAWSLLILAVVLAVFNTFLGEEFLFRGVLLPKMRGVFGRWDWLANAVIFGLYHLHEPWGIPTDILTALIFTGSSRRFHSNWFSIILHSGQSILLIFAVLGVILGKA